MSAIPSPDEAFRSNGATAERDEQGRFLAGRKGGPGRRKGSRSKLAEDVVTDVLHSWRQHGPIVLERLACLDPAKYADFIAKVLPREVKVEHTVTDGMSDEQLERMIELAEHMAAGGVVIEGKMRNVTPPPMPDAPPTAAEQRAAAKRLDLEDQSAALPHPVGRPFPIPAHEEARRNLAMLHEAEIDPESLF